MINDMEINDWLELDAIKLLKLAKSKAEKNKQRFYRGPHILLAAAQIDLLTDPLLILGVDDEQVREWLSESAGAACTKYSGVAEAVMDGETFQAVRDLGHRLDRRLSRNLLLEKILFYGIGFTKDEVDRAPFSFKDLADRLKSSRVGTGFSQTLAKNGQDQRTTTEFILSKYGDNLSSIPQLQKAKSFLPRCGIIDRIAGILGRLNRCSPLLVGEPGVGKTVLVKTLMVKLLDKDCPEWLKGCTIYRIPCSSLAAGATYQGQLEERLKQILDTAAVCRDVILFFDEIDLLGDSHNNGAANLLSLFGSYLEKDSFRIIAAATVKGFELNLRANEALVRRFEILKIPETTRQETHQILKDQVTSFENYYGCGIESDALTVIMNMCERFMPSLHFPAKAISVMDSAFQNHRELRASNSKAAERVQVHEVYNVVSRETGIPINRLSEIEHSRLKGLEDYLSSRVYDQSQATRAMSQAIQSLRLDLGDPGKTKVAFLFVGPPGTGKTELAKAVAEYLMGRAGALVRFNMSEFQTPESYQRLVGPPPGYVGYAEGGELANKLMENPYSVVLFDEIEKASSRIFDVLLQVLSDGHLTDNHGRVVDCKNSIFILTSNALTAVDELSDTDMRDKLLDYRDQTGTSWNACKFRREFLDRLEIIPFRALKQKTLDKIAAREVNRVIGQVNDSRVMQCHINLHEDVIGWISSQINAEVTGARSVQRLVESKISRFIGNKFIRNKILPGNNYILKLNDEQEPELKITKSERRI